jgi:hypothetical protein
VDRKQEAKPDDKTGLPAFPIHGFLIGADAFPSFRDHSRSGFAHINLPAGALNACLSIHRVGKSRKASARVCPQVALRFEG